MGKTQVEMVSCRDKGNNCFKMGKIRIQWSEFQNSHKLIAL